MSLYVYLCLFVFLFVFFPSPQTCRRLQCRWLSRSQGSPARRTGLGCRLAAPSVVKDVIIIIITIFINVLQGSTNCSILPSRMGEHGEHRERREHGKDGQHQSDDLKHSICDSKYSFWQPDDSKHFYVDGRKIRTYALIGEHDPGSNVKPCCHDHII